jgi:hypothetical protein
MKERFRPQEDDAEEPEEVDEDESEPVRSRIVEAVARREGFQDFEEVRESVEQGVVREDSLPVTLREQIQYEQAQFQEEEEPPKLLHKPTKDEEQAAENWVKGTAEGLCEYAAVGKECKDGCRENVAKKLKEKRTAYIAGLQKRKARPLKPLPPEEKKRRAKAKARRAKKKVGGKARQMLNQWVGDDDKRLIGGRVIRRMINR